MKKKGTHPPWIAGWLIRRMFPDRGGCSILGDMVETYHYLDEEKGPLWAWIWFWAQCIKAVPPFFIDACYWRIHMVKN
jgi:hypothetical protein